MTGEGTRTSSGAPGARIRRSGVWALYASALTPLVFSSRTIYPYVVPRAVYFRLLVAVGAAAAVYLLATRRRALPGWRRDPFLYALALFVGVLFVTALAGQAPVRSLFGDLERMGGVIAWAHFLAFYVAIRTLLSDRELTVFLWITLAVASVVSAIAILQAAGVQVGILPGPEQLSRNLRDRAIGTLGNAGYLAIYATVGLALAGFLGARASSRTQRGWAALGVSVCGAAMLLTWTRAALLGFGVGLLVGVVTYAVMTSARRRAWALAATIGLLLAAALGGARLWDRASDGGARATPEDDVSGRLADAAVLEQSLGRRVAAWQAGLRAVGDAPVAGLGAENFRLAFDWHLEPERSGYGIHYTRAHNGLVEALVAGGVPGGVMWIALWVGLFWCLAAARRERALGRGETALLAGTFVAYLVYLLFWFHDQNSLPVFLALAGFVASRRESAASAGDPPEADEPTAPRRVRVAVALALALIVAGDAVYHGRLLATGHHLLVAAEGGDLQSRVNHYRQAMELRPPGAEEAVTELARFAVQLPGAIRAAGGQPGSSSGVDTVLARSRAFLAAQIERDPRNPRLHRDAGRLHTITYQWNREPAHIDSATIHLREAIDLAPGRVRYRHMLSEALLMVDRTEDALRVLEEGLARYSDFGETHYFRAKALLVAGDHLAAAEALERAYQLGYRDRNPAVRQLLFRELRASGEEDVVARVREARRAPRRGSG